MATFMEQIKNLEKRIEELEKRQAQADKQITDYVSRDVYLMNQMSEQISAMPEKFLEALANNGFVK